MKLFIPTHEEAERLLLGEVDFRGWRVCAGALPPPLLLGRAIGLGWGTWQMPRLFCDEVLGQVVGSGGFKSEPQDRRIEIGYGVAPECQRRGYATAGVRLLCAEAFSSGLIDEVRAETLPVNAPSIAVLQKCGFTRHGIGPSAEGPVVLWRKPAGRLDPA